MISALPDAASTRTMHYRAFGLDICSQVPLSELTIVEPRAADVNIVWGGEDLQLPSFSDGVVFDHSAGSHYLGWHGVAAFRITGNNRIEVRSAEGVPVNYIAFPLLGPVMALLLHLRGMLVLHASAVEISGRSAIFVGDKLAGKSTTAAAFVRAGHRLITDDLLAIEIKSGEAVLHPAFAQIKLSNESASAVAIDGATALPLVHETFPKQQHRLPGEFLLTTVPPTRIYVLHRGGTVSHVQPLKGVEALQSVMRFSYITRFGKEALTRDQEAAHLLQCAELAGLCRVAKLTVPAEMQLLTQVISLVESDLE